METPGLLFSIVFSWCRFYKIRYFVGWEKKKATMQRMIAFGKWALTDSNRRPSACKADALNQLS